MTDTPFNVLILCTGNSARSIMGEGLINNRGRGHLNGFSAGSFPKGQVHPLALAELAAAGLSTDGYRSKSWDEFVAPGAPVMDFVFTVCDQAAGEVCPIWPGNPVTAHWGVNDPAAVEGSEIEKKAAFHRAFRELDNRIKVFASLPLRSLDRMARQAEARRIGTLSLHAPA